MLYPAKATQDHLKSLYQETTSVTNHYQASITAVPRVDNPPAWFAPIQTNLTTAQQHATSWLTNVCPTVSADINAAVVQFNSLFQKSSNQVLAILEQIGDGSPTAGQRKTVVNAMTTLENDLSSLATKLQSLHTQVVFLSKKSVSDQSTLATDLGTAQGKFADGKKWVTKIKEIIGEKFLDSTQLGPCHAIVEINFNISLQVQSTMADPTIIVLVYTGAILSNQINVQDNIRESLSSVLDTWTTLQVKYQAVISDLQSVQSDQFGSCIKALDLKTAQTQWQQLAAFVQQVWTTSPSFILHK